ncbi:hypothetical protein [Acinetobacter bereziniae]|uniref:hypothetical protein n=1 Tax=Acinetobacter bereziniae TaxID=106648 RepID=UPI0027E518CB|nr:hypothetical protein [Acinetobacter bereziniae]
MKNLTKSILKVVNSCHPKQIKPISEHTKSYLLAIPLARNELRSYAKYVQCKITELALVGYIVIGAYCPLRAFFMRIFSMRPHFMVKLGRDIFGCAGYLLHLSTNPFQLCHPHLVVNGKAPNLVIGAH